MTLGALGVSALALQGTFKTQGRHDQAGTRSNWALLNAYCREVAAPAGELGWDSPFGAPAWPSSTSPESTGSSRGPWI